jgi:hypothetical protein
VPAPIVLRTTCGAFWLARDGRLSRLPARWFLERQGGTGRRYGADLRIRRNPAGRITLMRKGHVVWRSSRLYRNDGGDVAFGPGAFAFSSYRRGIFVTDLKSPERRIVRGVGLYPLAFIRDGSLLVSRARSISLLSQSGAVLRRFRVRRGNGWSFDQRTESLFFVTPSRVLVRANGTNVRRIRPLGRLDGWMYPLAHDLIAFHGRRSVTVIRGDGRFVARASWPNARRWTFDSGLSASADARSFAFRLSKTNASRNRGRAVLYLVRAGESKARAVYRHRLGQVGCWTGASLYWHGGFLLYSSADGELAVFDARDGSPTTLTALGRALPRKNPGEDASAYWASSLAPPR